MQPDYSYLVEKLDLSYPLIGVYDSDNNQLFKDFEEPGPSKHVCIFAYYKAWLNGKMARLSDSNYGCGGCGTWWFNQNTRSREEYLDFLANDEGLKDSEELMGEWFDKVERFKPKNKYLFIGPLVSKAYHLLETVTFFVNPDQLSVLFTGANYFSRFSDKPPVVAEFGSGCMQMLTLLADHDKPKAMIGSTDMAMRLYLPHDVMAFTVNKPMFDDLCKLDDRSFLGKPFLQNLRKSRGGSLDK
jgi:hypothetical protein